MTASGMAQRAPIGYWLKHTDEVITQHVDRVLADNGFTRTRWQVLNIVYEAGTIPRQEVFAVMKTFIDAGQLDGIVAGFVEAGWLMVHGTGDAAELEITEAGKAQRETNFRLQSDVRKRAMQGITEQEYALVIQVLQRMVHNLE